MGGQITVKVFELLEVVGRYYRTYRVKSLKLLESYLWPS